MQRFKHSEFDCKCGGCRVKGVDMDKSTLQKLDAAAIHDQEANGYFPWVVTSGLRCVKHNASVGGSKTSSHLAGCGHAIDIRTASGSERHRIITSLTAAGFNRFGIAKTFVHVDDDPKKAIDVIWTY